MEEGCKGPINKDIKAQFEICINKKTCKSPINKDRKICINISIHATDFNLKEKKRKDEKNTENDKIGDLVVTFFL